MPSKKGQHLVKGANSIDTQGKVVYMTLERRDGTLLYTLIDEADYDKVRHYRWSPYCVPHTTYVRADIAGKKILLHKFLTGFSQTDHRNRNGLDNRRSNLRAASTSTNHQNMAPGIRNTSGFKGVTKKRKKWSARIKVGTRQLSLGSYFTKEDAARAYDKAAKEYFKEFAWLNFPESRIA